MTRSEFEQRTHGKFHHRAVFTLTDGSTKEGYMQPFDNEFVYLTTLEGLSGGRIALSDIRGISFPDN